LGHEFDKSSCEETKGGEKNGCQHYKMFLEKKGGKRRKKEALVGKNIHEN
jgi:hypothetical protein